MMRRPASTPDQGSCSPADHRPSTLALPAEGHANDRAGDCGRLRAIAGTLGITDRAAFGIVTDLVEAGYVIKDKNGRRTRYEVQVDEPLQRLC